MKLRIKPQAVSWKNRKVKVAGQWAYIHPNINLLRFRVGEECDVEIETRLDGNKSIEKIYQGKE